MEDRLISIQTARLAREKGFHEEVKDYLLAEPEDRDESIYGNSQYKHDFNSGKKNSSGEPLISAPTQALLQKWLRERHRIHIAINGLYNNNIMIAYTFDICLVDANPYKEGVHSVMTYPTYEEALETALKQALNKIQ